MIRPPAPRSAGGQLPLLLTCTLLGCLLGLRLSPGGAGGSQLAPGAEAGRDCRPAAAAAATEAAGAAPGGRWAFAYYITTEQYLCAALVNAKRLRGPLRATPKADIVVMHSSQLGTAEQGYSSKNVKYIMGQLQGMGVLLKPVEPLLQDDGINSYFRESLTKLRVFELEEYDKVVIMDADGLAWRNLDHLFLLPPARIAMPRCGGEWDSTPGGKFASHFAVVEPSKAALQELLKEASKKDGKPHFDMDVLSALYGRSCIALPNSYGVLTAAFTDENRAAYVDGDNRPWDSKRMLKESYYIHFTGIVPKPWDASREAVESASQHIEKPDDKEAWVSIYETYWGESQVCQRPA